MSQPRPLSLPHDAFAEDATTEFGAHRDDVQSVGRNPAPRHDFEDTLGVFINWGTQKLLVYMGKPLLKRMIWEYT